MVTVTKIISWNLNSIKQRQNHLIKLIQKESPDIICLQEIKCETESVDVDIWQQYGYSVAAWGQKSFNGVAITAKAPLANISYSFTEDPKPDQARVISAETMVAGLPTTVISLYLPNGGEVGSDKFDYKLEFFDKFTNYINSLRQQHINVIIAGDYNVAPDAIDVYAPEQLDGTTCYHPQERARLQRLFNSGLFDLWRLKHPGITEFSWWDYRGASLQQEKGLRIDHILSNAKLADQLTDAAILDSYRKLDKPSDHAPVMVVFN
ncbi:MAG: exodeoxyribonuclease III [Pseudomonadota bacterium]